MAKDMSDKTFVYHATKEARIVTVEEANELYKQGWADSPAAAKGVVPEEDDPTIEVDEPKEDPPVTTEQVEEVSDTETANVPEEDVTGNSNEPESNSDSAPATQKPFSQLNVVELEKLATEEGVVLAVGMSKAQMREEIIKSRNEKNSA